MPTPSRRRTARWREHQASDACRWGEPHGFGTAELINPAAVGDERETHVHAPHVHERHGPAVAERFLAAFQARDWEMLRGLLADDITWTMPGTGTISGNAHGADAVVNRARHIASQGLHTELLHMLVGAHGAALSLRNTATAADGRTLDEHLATVLTVHSGRIVTIDSYLSDIDGMSAFFAAP
ncbi:nuclear transport factor 2 family protein [Streptomyces sp. NPDC001922]|uniref:nuclear transport factor 2 family protein n=1 Tax=Streptomyces sp. NPDC001922 TaxID=3364624 RepID=UPI0036C6DEFC